MFTSMHAPLHETFSRLGPYALGFPAVPIVFSVLGGLVQPIHITIRHVYSVPSRPSSCWLNPAIHPAPLCSPPVSMDHRVKAGGDEKAAARRRIKFTVTVIKLSALSPLFCHRYCVICHRYSVIHRRVNSSTGLPFVCLSAHVPALLEGTPAAARQEPHIVTS